MQKGELFVWSHPFDFHFKVNELSGWYFCLYLGLKLYSKFGDSMTPQVPTISWLTELLTCLKLQVSMS